MRLYQRNLNSACNYTGFKPYPGMLRVPRTHFCEMSAKTCAFVVANPRLLHVDDAPRRLGLHKSRHKTSNLITCKDCDTQVKRSYYPRKLPDNRGARVLTNCNYPPARPYFRPSAVPHRVYYELTLFPEGILPVFPMRTIILHFSVDHVTCECVSSFNSNVPRESCVAPIIAIL